MICPLMTIGGIKDSSYVECQADKCAWWNDGESVCAIKSIARQLNDIRLNTQPIEIPMPDSIVAELAK